MTPPDPSHDALRSEVTDPLARRAFWTSLLIVISVIVTGIALVWDHRHEPPESFHTISTLGLAVITLAAIGLHYLLVIRPSAAILRQHAEAARAAGQRYRQMFYKNNAVQFVLDPETGRIIDANTAATKFYGYPLETLLTLNLSNINTAPRERLAEGLSNALAGTETEFVFQHRRADGDVRTVRVFTGPVEIEGRTHLHSIIHDITEEQRARTAAEESQRKHQALLDAIQSPVVAVSPDLTIHYCNEAFASQAQADRGTLVGSSVAARFAPLSDAGALAVVREAIEASVARVVEVSRGDRIWRLQCYPSPQGLLIIADDITMQRRAQDSLRDREARNRLLVEQMPAVLWTTDRDLRFTSSVGAAMSGLGLRPHDLDGKLLAEYIGDADTLDTILASHAEALLGKTVRYEITFQDRTFRVRLEPLTGRSGEVIGTIGVALDVTETITTERALRQAEEKYRGIFENAMIGIYVTDLTGRFRTANPMLAHILGYESPQQLMEEMTDPSHQLYVEPGRREAFMRAILHRGSVEQFDSEVYRRDGSRIWVSEEARVIYGPDRRAAALEGTLMDITRRKEVERLLDYRARFEALIASISARFIDLPLNQARLALRDAVDQLARYSGAMRAMLFLTADRDPTFELLHEWNDSSVSLEPVPLRTEPLRIWLRDADTHDLFLAPTLEAIFERRPHTRHIGAESPPRALALPMMHHGMRIGVFALQAGSDRPAFSEDEISRLRVAAEIFSNAWLRWRNERDLRDSEERFRALADSRQVLLSELNHRVKNNLASLLGLLAVLQSRSDSVEDLAVSVAHYIKAMEAVHNLLADKNWGSIDLKTFLAGLDARITGYIPSNQPPVIDGPTIRLLPRQMLPIGMIYQELLTNSRKYGARSTPDGQVTLRWEILNQNERDLHVRFHWIEQGGPTVSPPAKTGIGLHLINRFAQFELRGSATFEFPSEGFRCILEGHLRIPGQDTDTPQHAPAALTN